MISQGANPRAMSNQFKTPLHFAALQNNPKVLKYLLDSCPEPQECLKFMMAEDEQKCTPLHLACKNGSQECIELLLEHEYVLMQHLREQAKDVINQLIKNEILKENIFDVAHHVESDAIDLRKITDISIIMYSRDMRKWTPLHYASYNGHAKAVNFLLKREADQDELHLKRNT